MTRSSAASKNAASKADGIIAADNKKAIDTATADVVVSYEYPEWLDRRQEIEDRLKIISIPQPLTAKTTKATTTAAGSSNKKPRSRRRGGGAKSQASLETQVETNEPQTTQTTAATVALIPYAPKTDVHWDFVMKELMWLGADFQGERKRQVASAKKLGASIIKFHENKEKRRLKQLQMAETNRKKLAAKLGRGVKGWWTKLEKIVSYKQKLSSDRERQGSMNKQLVKLVQQTEKYTESLSLNNASNSHRVSTEEEDSDDDDDDGEMSTDDEKVRNRKRRRRRKRQHQQQNQITIEEALALGAASRRRKTKSRIIDYSRMKLEESEFYGESTADEGSMGGSGTELEYDEEYSPPPSDDEHGSKLSNDDETTLEMAMVEEMRARHERKQQQRQPLRQSSRRGKGQLKKGDEDDDWADVDVDYFADPVELRKLHEEQEMDMEQVLERLREEEEEEATDMEIEENEDIDATTQKATKHVHFEEERATTVATSANEASPRPKRPRVDPGEDADDDGDASDVEDYHDALESFGTIETATGKEDDADDTEDFHACEPEPDDETTMEAEERLGRDMTYKEEIELLNRENEMSVEELRAMYAGMNNAMDDNTATAAIETTTAATTVIVTVTTDDKPTENTTEENEKKDQEEIITSDDDDGEFEADKNEVDDETTMEVEERLGRDMTHEQELEMLTRENEMSVEELRAMYAGMKDNNSGKEEDDSDQPQTTEDETNAETSVTDDFFSASDDDGEFQVTGAPEADDETTMEAEERLGRDMTYEEELKMLNRENEMSVEELRAMYAGMSDVNETFTGDDDGTGDDDENDDGNESQTVNSRGRRSASKTIDNDSSNSDELFSASDDDGEFQVTGAPEVDDETTMEAEERLGRDISYEQELEMLTRENEMSVEELRAMYTGMNGADEDENDDDVDDNVEMDVEDDSKNKRDTATKVGLDEGEKKRKREESVSDDSLSGTGKGTKRSREGTVLESVNDGTAAMKALEASAVKARETLATRPFLLAPWVKLRKYQQVGLNWLVSLQSRRLNGILADEMGLGKTLQTISLLAYLAAFKGIWGPHLVVVPTSVIINWETELKRFCPGFKVLCYYGNAKRRKELRTGWTKANWYHVVITSYQLAVQDAFAFKRKKWYYLILDEAQNIKNFQSQRWQTLINFNTQRRLLLTGTPLQNSLMELWSLLHFLMPYIFKSRKEFSYWFSNPMNNIIEGTANRNDDVIKRLHGIIRPFILRRLKKEVETQMPGKFEHVVKCQLSRRQMTLYEEFLSRSSTRQALKKGGNFMGMMNVLMQLRKVCNHPDLFEPRSVVTPFILPSITITTPRCVCEIHDDDFVNRISASVSKPLWCGSSGLPNIDLALRHDQIESNGLNTLCAEFERGEAIEFNDDGSCPTELQTLITEIYKKRNENQVSKIQFQNSINRRRCKALTFPYSLHLLNALEVECNIFGRKEPAEVRHRQVIETPAKLLELRRSEMERANDMEETIEKFVFRVPPAGGRAPIFDNGIPKTQGESGLSKDVEGMLLEPIEEVLEPYRKARVRLTSFFPDKKLIQYDAGKLQALCPLLRTLKEGGHRCLIFTQMGKILDVLEAFLSMNGHTYLRLDGSTGIDKRQRYMDRFNNDIKIFCFILSTRSGGTGINLTGADTVIFYDSDWNPAMDAQAQDRAHRIGQTRDVHIYRLITEHSIEENILKKAQKKKNLDIMVMDQGKFNASAPPTQEDSSETDDVKDVYSKKGLQAILGFVDEDKDSNPEEQEQSNDMSKDEMEKAMASLEDEDDVKALHEAQKEAEEDQKEFDEDAAILKEGSDDDEDEAENGKGKKNKGKTIKKGKGKLHYESKSEGDEQNTDEKDLEKEFASWQSTEGFDEKVIDKSLSPLERYGLNFREDIDPFYSIFYINEERRRMEATVGVEEVDMGEVERQKAMEEQQAIDNQDLLATGIRPEDLVRQRSLYRREKVRLRSEKMRRKITGELWTQKVDGLSKKLFWYNEETGEATWDIPLVNAELQAQDLSIQEGWSHLPMKPLTRIMSYLLPFPERQRCSAVCRQWRFAATDVQFVRHVYPVEMGALANREPSKRHHNHYKTIEDALVTALPGDTIELGDGHYWVNDPGIIIDKPLRFVGDENNPANVVIEMSGSVQCTANGGWIEGITFRRPKMSSGKDLPSFPMLELMEFGRINMVHSVFDNDGSTGPVGHLSGSGNKGLWRNIVFRNGGSAGIHIDGGDKVEVELIGCIIKGSRSDGLVATNKAKFKFDQCTVEDNEGYGVRLATGGCQAGILESQFKDNIAGVIKKEPHCIVTSSSNTAFLTVKPKRQIPGFKLMLLKKDPSLL